MTHTRYKINPREPLTYYETIRETPSHIMQEQFEALKALNRCNPYKWYKGETMTEFAKRYDFSLLTPRQNHLAKFSKKYRVRKKWSV